MKKDLFTGLLGYLGDAAVVIAAMMTVGTASAVMAAVPTSQTIADGNASNEDGKYTISVATGDTHTYKVYQILTGTLIAGENKLGNPAWGSDAIGTGSVSDFITSLEGKTDNVTVNGLVEAQLTEGANGVGTITKDSSLDVVPGYYLIVDTTTGLADNDAKSLNIVAVFNDIQIKAKKGTTTSEKHVDDQNDSNSGDHSELKDSADYDIGDHVPYTLTMTLPEDYANYKQYKVVFTDDMSAGLTLDTDSVKITYGSAAATAINFTAGGTSSYTGGTVYTYTIGNLKATDATDAQKALTAGSVIKITYTATLNKNAVVGSAGNPNKYKVDYSSNPNQDATGTPETNDTPWDTNIVFTYKTVFNKVDAQNNPLTGADFTLYKFVESTNGADTYGEKKGTWTDVTTLGSDENKPAKATEAYTKGEGDDAKTAAAAKFTFSGIDAGVYKLVESETPTGYNKLDDQIFTITAEHVLEADNPTLTSLTGANGTEFTMVSDLTAGSLTTEIVNRQGAELPSTGGIGTTIFYVIGAILVLGAGILLVSKRRMAE